MIEKILPGNKTRYKIVQTIYENTGINITNLIKKVKASPNLVLEYVNRLSAHHIIEEEKSGGRKKVHIRILRPSFDNELARIVYSSIEINKLFLFFKRYQKLKPHFLQVKEIMEGKKAFVLIYGSYARYAATEDSDLDMIIVGKLQKEETKEIKEVFVTAEPELSLKIETVNSFLKNKDKPLYRNMVREHTVIYGVLYFMKVLGKIHHYKG